MVKALGAVLGLALGALLAPAGADAQQAAKPHTIGYLSISAHERVAHLLGALEDGLRSLGYVEGRDIGFQRRFADGNPDRLAALAADLVERKPSLIVAYGATAARAAKNATATIPIVMLVHPDPVAAGLVASITRPGGNVTGLARLSQELSAKRLELLKEAIPGLSHVAALWFAGSRDGEQSLQEIQKAARPLGIKVQVLGVRGPGELEGAFAAMKREGSSALITVPSTLFFDNHPQIVGLATKHRLPAVFPDSEYAESGGLMAYGARLSHEFHRAAVYVDKILKGASPAELPVEQPTRFDFVVNLKTARAFGLAIPPSVLLRADRVLE